MNSNKIVIALFEKLKGHFIDWFDLKYVYHHHKVAKKGSSVLAKEYDFSRKTIILYNYV